MNTFVMLHLGTCSCAMLGIVMFCLGLMFALGKEKAAYFISGFNTYAKEERVMYDTSQMSLDMRNLFFKLTILLFLGVFFSIDNQLLAIPFFLLWILCFFKSVHWDDEQAFGHYKREEKYHEK